MYLQITNNRHCFALHVPGCIFKIQNRSQKSFKTQRKYIEMNLLHMMYNVYVHINFDTFYLAFCL